MSQQRMSQQDMTQFPDRPRRRLSRYIITFAIFTFVCYVISSIIYVLQIYNIIHGPWIMPLFAVFTGLGTTAGIPAAVLTFLQFIHVLASREASEHIYAHDPPIYRNIQGVPPLTNPKTIHPREKDVKEIYTQLTRKDATAIVLVGLAYIGKSTLAALIFDYVEKLRNQRIRQFFRRILRRAHFLASPVWLTIDSSTTMADIAKTLYEAFEELLPRNFDHSSPQNQVRRLHHLLDTTKKARLIIIDQLDTILNPHSGYVLPDHSSLGEWLDTLNSRACKCRIIITSRVWPRGNRNQYPTHMKKYLIDVLDVAEGIKLLRKREVQGNEEELRRVVEYCNGHVCALDLLATLQWHNRIPNLTTLLENSLYANIWRKEIERLFDPIFKEQLDREHRELLLAFSVFREYVPLVVALSIRDFTRNIAQAQSLSILHVLVSQHLVQESDQHAYRLPVILAAYVEKHFSDSDEQSNQQALQEAHIRAAEYYEGLPSPAQRQSIDDLHSLIEAILHRCLAGQWQQAYDMIRAQDVFSTLKRWGNNEPLLELYQLLLPLDKWRPDPLQEAIIYKDLGTIYDDLGQKEKALEYYELAMGKYKAIYYWREEGELLITLGDISRESKQHKRASEYYETVLSLYQSQGNHRGQGHIYGKLGEVYRVLGNDVQAQQSYILAFKASELEGNSAITCATLNGMGTLYFGQENYKPALACFRLAEQSGNCDGIASNIKVLRERMGQKPYRELVASIEGQELEVIRQSFTEGV